MISAGTGIAGSSRRKSVAVTCRLHSIAIGNGVLNINCATQSCRPGEVSATKNAFLPSSIHFGKSAYRILVRKNSNCSAGMPLGLSGVLVTKGVAAGAIRAILSIRPAPCRVR